MSASSIATMMRSLKSTLKLAPRFFKSPLSIKPERLNNAYVRHTDNKNAPPKK